MDRPTIQVTLSDLEMDFARRIAEKRQSENKKAGRVDAHGHPPDNAEGIETHFKGVCGEMVVARGFNLNFPASYLYVRTASDLHDAIGPLEARCRARHDWGLLWSFDKDKMAPPYIHVTYDQDGPADVFYIRGWLFGHECADRGKFEDLHNGRPPAWIIQTGDLHNLRNLSGRGA